MTRSLIRAFISLLHPRMLGLMVWPVAVALALWIVLALLFWGQAAAGVDVMLRGTPVVEWMFAVAPLAAIAAHLGWILLALLFVPLVLLTATIIIGVFAMPMMVNHIGERDYPRLARRHGGGAVGSAWSALVALLWFCLLAVVSLPLWLVPPLWPALPALLLGYLNYRVFAYDSLAEHASADELDRILRQDRAPLYGGLAFIHYGLARLDASRTAPIEGVAQRVED